MKAKKQKEVKAPVHIMLDTPLLLRKEILSAAIDATKLLKSYEELTVLKLKKAKTLNYLQREMKTIKRLSKEFNEHTLPTVPHELPSQPKVVHHKEALQRVIVKQAAAPKKPHTEVDKLNAELRGIEEKLGNL